MAQARVIENIEMVDTRRSKGKGGVQGACHKIPELLKRNHSGSFLLVINNSITGLSSIGVAVTALQTCPFSLLGENIC